MGCFSFRRYAFFDRCTLCGGVFNLPFTGALGFGTRTVTRSFWSAEWDIDVPGGTVFDQAVSYYGADQKLRAFNRVIGIDSISDDWTPGRRGVFEEYRYDALGRRVLKRTRHDSPSACPADDAECARTVERTVWDGDQILYEIRARGSDTTAAAEFEVDNATAGTSEAYSYGRVVYTHGGGIDQPLGIIRLGMTGLPDPWVMFPHANWRGSFEAGTDLSGTVCYPGAGCILPFPGRGTSADGEVMQPSQQFAWFGNLIQGKTDGSGLQYMRNRYYDPKTGRLRRKTRSGSRVGSTCMGSQPGIP